MMWCCTNNSLKFFKAVADRHRQKILAILKNKESLNATSIKNIINLSQPTISHHLAMLVEAGLLKTTKKGKEVYYSLSKTKISTCCLGFVKDLLT